MTHLALQMVVQSEQPQYHTEKRCTLYIETILEIATASIELKQFWSRKTEIFSGFTTSKSCFYSVPVSVM